MGGEKKLAVFFIVGVHCPIHFPKVGLGTSPKWDEGMAYIKYHMSINLGTDLAGNEMQGTDLTGK
jgi:hypothetical protein